MVAGKPILARTTSLGRSRGIPGYPGGSPRGSAGEAGPMPPRPLPPQAHNSTGLIPDILFKKPSTALANSPHLTRNVRCCSGLKVVGVLGAPAINLKTEPRLSTERAKSELSGNIAGSGGIGCALSDARGGYECRLTSNFTPLAFASAWPRAVRWGCLAFHFRCDAKHGKDKLGKIGRSIDTRFNSVIVTNTLAECMVPRKPSGDALAGAERAARYRQRQREADQVLLPPNIAGA